MDTTNAIDEAHLKGRIKAINERLKAAKVPVRVRHKGNALYLRCSRLPPKPGDELGKRYEIPQGPTTTATMALIETRAHAMWRAVVESRFSWPEYDAGVQTTDTFEVWIDHFEKHYLQTHSDCSERTFEKHWRQAVFNKLPQKSVPSPELFLAGVLSTAPHTRLRKQTCQKLSKLAEFIGLDIDLKQYKGNYGSRSVERRDLPTDEQIEQWYADIPNPVWQRIFARIVVFGLRPSESFFFELSDTYTARVLDAKSREWRTTKAFHPRWAEQWEFEGELPKIGWSSDKCHEVISSRIANRFKGYGIKCQRYDLRHAWCVRVSVEYKIPVEVAAKWAGHGADVHQEIYNKWIRTDQQERVYQTMALGRDELDVDLEVLTTRHK